MPEHNRFAHASNNPGRMHGCGHDGHTAMLLGAAQHLAVHRDFDGIINFIFQPAEEGGNAGARAMMQDGLFERFPCDEVYGMHNMPGFPVGHFGFRKGPTMASSNRFDIIVRGTGGHAAQPHKAVDTIVIAAEMVGVLQTLISRHKNPIDVAVLSVTQIHAGDAYNVLPDEAVIRGTVRTFSTQVLDEIEANMRRVAETLPQVHGGTGELQFYRAYPPLVNWDAQTDFAMKVAQDVFGADKRGRQHPAAWRRGRFFVLPGESAGLLPVHRQRRRRAPRSQVPGHGAVRVAQPPLRFQRCLAAGRLHLLGALGASLFRPGVSPGVIARNPSCPWGAACGAGRPR